MNQQERDMVGTALGNASFFYGIEMDKLRISMMIDSMINVWPEASAEKIVDAIKNYQADPKNSTFPFPAKLAQYVRPVVSVDAQALEIMSRINQSISKFGYTGFEAAKEFIGPIGWAVVRRSGGWQLICEGHGSSINPGQFTAQTRDLIKAQIEIEKSGMNVDNLLEHRENNQLDAPQVKGLIATMLEKNKMPVADE